MISSWHRFVVGWLCPVPEIDVQLYAKYGTTKSVAQAIFDHKPPGMKLWADIPEGQPQTSDPLKITGTAVDAYGNSHSVDFIKTVLNWR